MKPDSLRDCSSLADVLADVCRRHPDGVAVCWAGREITYTELQCRARAVAAGVRAAGLRSGDRCAIWLPNTGEFVELYFGLAMAGVVAVPVNFRFTPAEASHVLHDAQPAAVLYHRQFRDRLAATRWTPDERGVLLRVEIGECAADGGAEDYEEWLERSSDQAAPAPTGDTAFFIGYTSGTTGLPKGAVVRQRPMLENVAVMLRDYAPLHAGDRFLTLMPLFHSNSTWFAITCVAAGATNVVMDSGQLTGEKILDTVDGHAVTATSVVPTILQMLLDARRNRADGSGRSLRLLLCGSAPITAAMKQRVMGELSAALVEGYGATETGVVTSLPPAAQLEKLTSVGWPVTGKQVELRDAEGHVVPVGAVGELWCRGAGVLLDHYWRNEAATRAAHDGDGWFSVGDMGRRDEDGAVYLVDRKNDMIISGGENIYPTEVETAILRHPAVREVAVVGLPDERWGERVHAVVALVAGAHADQEEIVEAAAAHLARYKLPRSVETWADLPKTPTGKIQRRRVRDAVVSTTASRMSSTTGQPA